MFLGAIPKTEFKTVSYLMQYAIWYVLMPLKFINFINHHEDN